MGSGTIVTRHKSEMTRRYRLAVSHAALLVSLVVAGCSGTAFLERQSMLSDTPKQLFSLRLNFEPCAESHRSEP